MSSKMWPQWYEAQIREQQYNKKVYPLVKPSLLPARNSSPTLDAKALHGAMEGFAPDKGCIIRILTRRTLRDRLLIQDKYQQLYGTDLVKDLEKELSGILEKVILSLLKPLPLFLAERIKNATDGRHLLEILCTRDDISFIQSITEAFEMTYGYSLEREIHHRTEGNYTKLLMRIMISSRDDFASTPKDVAAELTNKDIEEDDIRRIFTSYTFPFLEKVFKEYQDKTGKEFVAVIKGKYSDTTEAEFMVLYEIVMDRPEYFADYLHTTLIYSEEKEYEWDLIRIIVSRCEIDMGTILEINEKRSFKAAIPYLEEYWPEHAKVLISLLGGGSYNTDNAGSYNTDYARGNYNSEKKVESDDSCAIL